MSACVNIAYYEIRAINVEQSHDVLDTLTVMSETRAQILL